jgi:hypothetical protein
MRRRNGLHADRNANVAAIGSDAAAVARLTCASAVEPPEAEVGAALCCNDPLPRINCFPPNMAVNGLKKKSKSK